MQGDPPRGGTFGTPPRDRPTARLMSAATSAWLGVPEPIRPKFKAYAILLNPAQTHHLVWHGRADESGAEFDRLLGGQVEFGEYAADAIVRELAEELGLAIAKPEFVAVVENISETEGEIDHQVIFVYIETLTEPLPVPPGGGVVDDNGTLMPCWWRPIRDEDLAPLYPEGLGDYLRGRFPAEAND